jgi:transposase InsO family protein
LGTSKGCKVCFHAVMDAYCIYAFGFLHISKQPEAAVLHNEVLPFYAQKGLEVANVLTDNGKEFLGSEGHPYRIYLDQNDIEHRTSKVGRRQTNGLVERFNRTLDSTSERHSEGSSRVGGKTHVLIMTGHQRMWMLGAVAFTVTGFIGCFALVPIYGMLEAAWVTAGSLAVGSVASLVAVHRVMKSWPYTHLHLNSLIAGLRAAGTVFLVRSVLSLSEGIPAILVLTPIFGVSITVMLFALGLSPSDRNFLKAMTTAAWHTARRGT